MNIKKFTVGRHFAATNEMNSSFAESRASNTFFQSIEGANCSYVYTTKLYKRLSLQMTLIHTIRSIPVILPGLAILIS